MEEALMKPTLLLTACLVAGPVTLAWSQEPAPAESPKAPATAGPTLGERAQERLALLKERLKLTPEQEAKIRPILEEEAAKLKDLRAQRDAAGATQDRRERIKQVRAIQQETQDRVNPILTPEQQAEWTKLRDEMRERVRDRYRERS
jgi:Spy/CpxP family protein refolding chaperone